MLHCWLTCPHWLTPHGSVQVREVLCDKGRWRTELTLLQWLEVGMDSD